MKFQIKKQKRRRRRSASFRDWVENYKRWIAVGGILVCVLVIVAVTQLGKNKDAEKVEEITAQQTDIAEAGDEDVLQETVEEVEIPNDLLQDEYPAINALMDQYYSCMAAGDVEGVMALVDVLSESEQSYIESLKTLIEGYQNIRCYTKRGIQEGEYLVFVRYDLKFIAVDTLAPGVQGYYVKADEAGAPYIFLDVPDEALTAFVNEMVQDADVQALYTEVWNEFENAKASDEKLAEYGTKLEQLMSGEEDAPEGGETAEGEDPAEGGEEGETPQEGEGESAPEQEIPEGGSVVVNRETRFKESTNVRSGRSTDTDRLALGYQGEKVTEIEKYSDGWSKIRFKDKEGYCKSEFLE